MNIEKEQKVIKMFEELERNDEKTAVIDIKNINVKATNSDGLSYSTQKSRDNNKKFVRQKEVYGTPKRKLQRSEGENFVIMLYKINIDLLKQYKLDKNDITRLIYLSTFLNYDNKLMLTEQTIMTKINMQEKLKLSRNIFGKFYNKLLSNKILIQNDKYYELNRKYFIRGNMKKREKNNGYIRIYISTVRYLYENATIKSHRTLSVLFRTIPYLNVKYNIVCKNPDEEVFELVNPITFIELGKILGYSTDGIKELKKVYKNIITSNKEPILYCIPDGSDIRKKEIFINPSLFCGSMHLDQVEIIKASYNNVK